MSAPSDLAFGPDGMLYVCNYFGEVVRYNATTGAAVDVFASFSPQIGGLAFQVPEPSMLALLVPVTIFLRRPQRRD